MLGQHSLGASAGDSKAAQATDFILGGAPAPTYYVTLNVVRADLKQCPGILGYADLFAQVEWENTDGNRREPLYTETQWGCKTSAVWQHECPPQVWKKPARRKDTAEAPESPVGAKKTAQGDDACPASADGMGPQKSDRVTLQVKQQTLGGLGSAMQCGCVTIPVEDLVMVDGQMKLNESHELKLTDCQTHEEFGSIVVEVSVRPASAVVVLSTHVSKERTATTLWGQSSIEEDSSSSSSDQDDKVTRLNSRLSRRSARTGTNSAHVYEVRKVKPRAVSSSVAMGPAGSVVDRSQPKVEARDVDGAGGADDSDGAMSAITVFSVDSLDDGHAHEMSGWATSGGKLLPEAASSDGQGSSDGEAGAASWNRIAAATLSEKKWVQEDDKGLVASYGSIAELAAQLRITVRQYPASTTTRSMSIFGKSAQEVFVTIDGATDVFSVMRAFASVAATKPSSFGCGDSFRSDDNANGLTLSWYSSESAWANRQTSLGIIELSSIFDARVIHVQQEVKVLVQFTKNDEEASPAAKAEEDDDEDAEVFRHTTTDASRLRRLQVEFVFPDEFIAEEWAEKLNILCDTVNDIEQ